MFRVLGIYNFASNVALAKRNPSLRPATKSSELIKFARRVKLCFVHLLWLGGLQGFQLELNHNILVSLEGESTVSEVIFNSKGCGGGPKVPTGQEIVCHFSQGRSGSFYGHKNS